MFKVIPNGKDRLDIEMSGKLNAEEMKIALDELVSKSENIEKGKHREKFKSRHYQIYSIMYDSQYTCFI